MKTFLMLCVMAWGVGAVAEQLPPVVEWQPGARPGVLAYDFNGPRLVIPARPSQICPQIFHLEHRACQFFRGRGFLDVNCGAVCSVPIAHSGFIAGYDFEGFQVRQALPPGMACAQASGSQIAVTDACLRAGGRTWQDVSCQPLCTRPIAQ